MNANELADELTKMFRGEEYDRLIHEIPDMLRKQAEEIEYWKQMFSKSMDMQEAKPAKYSDAWWKEVEEFNKQLKAQEK